MAGSEGSVFGHVLPTTGLDVLVGPLVCLSSLAVPSACEAIAPSQIPTAPGRLHNDARADLAWRSRPGRLRSSLAVPSA